MKSSKAKHKIISSSLVTAGLVGVTATTGLALTSSFVSADDVVDDVAITVPISCTMSGTGMNTHTKEVVNGTYEANIGTTTMKVLCNDNSGFSIYATGFTNEEIAGTNSNKLVGTNASGNATIDTGIAQSGNTSNWAMKLATNSQATYPITITSDTEGPFSTYHTVPSTWTKVATRLAGTDIGAVAEGSTITSTYAAYINSTQPADTYTGKVKYTLVHPNDAPVPVVPTLGVYTLSRTDNGESPTQIGEAIPQDVEVYDTAEEAFEATLYGYRACLKHIIVNDVIAESYVVGDAADDISHPPILFEIRGGIDESGLSEKPIFTANKNALKEAYDYVHYPDNCTDDDNSFYCNNATTNENGEAYFNHSGLHCDISTSGESRCEYN